MVFWFCVIGMLAICFLALVFAVQNTVQKRYLRAGGFGIIGILSGATLAFFITAASLSEPALQQALPPIAGWLLGARFISAALLAVWTGGALMRAWRPVHWFAWVTVGIGFVLVIRFVLFLTQWNALGWNYP